MQSSLLICVRPAIIVIFVELFLHNISYETVSNAELSKVSQEELTNEIEFDYYISTEKKKHYVIFHLQKVLLSHSF